MPQASKARVADFMRTEVVRLEASAPIADAVRTLEENDIGGAPVVDGADNVVGVLSLSDIVRSEHMREGRIDAERGEYYLADPLEERFDEDADEFAAKEDFSPRVTGQETVGDWMHTEVISVDPGASLKRVCKVMNENGIHRVLVLEGRRLVGIVSTLDVVRHIAEEAG